MNKFFDTCPFCNSILISERIYTRSLGNNSYTCFMCVDKHNFNFNYDSNRLKLTDCKFDINNYRFFYFEFNNVYNLNYSHVVNEIVQNHNIFENVSFDSLMKVIILNNDNDIKNFIDTYNLLK